MTIIQATRHPMNFARIGGDVLIGNAGYGTGTVWDPAYVKMLLRCDSGGVSWRHPFRDLAGASLALTDHWWQIEGQLASGGASSNGNVRFLFHDSAGVGIIRQAGSISSVSNLWQFWNGTTWVSFAFNSTPGLAFGLYIWSMRYFRHATVGECSIYLNNVLVAQQTGNTVWGASGPKDMDYSNLTIGSGASGQERLSGAVVTTGNENPYGIKVKTHVLTADGTYTQMVGPYSNVDDENPDTADIISASTTGLKRSIIMDDLPTLSGSDVVRGIYVSALARRGSGGGPTQLQQGIRASSADQPAPAHTLTTGWTVINDFLDTDSTTGNEFTPTAVNGAELLLET